MLHNSSNSLGESQSLYLNRPSRHAKAQKIAKYVAIAAGGALLCSIATCVFVKFQTIQSLSDHLQHTLLYTCGGVGVFSLTTMIFGVIANRLAEKSPNLEILLGKSEELPNSNDLSDVIEKTDPTEFKKNYNNQSGKENSEKILGRMHQALATSPYQLSEQLSLLPSELFSVIVSGMNNRPSDQKIFLNVQFMGNIGSKLKNIPAYEEGKEKNYLDAFAKEFCQSDPTLTNQNWINLFNNLSYICITFKVSDEEIKTKINNLEQVLFLKDN